MKSLIKVVAAFIALALVSGSMLFAADKKAVDKKAEVKKPAAEVTKEPAKDDAKKKKAPKKAKAKKAPKKEEAAK